MGSSLGSGSVWFAALACAVACRAEQTRPADPAPQPPSSAGTAATEQDASSAAKGAPAVVDAGERPAPAERLVLPSTETGSLIAHLARGRIARARPVSRRSLSLKLSLRGGPDAVFKPLRRGDRTARHEVAAFRLSRLLGLDGVPPSTMRRILIDNFSWMLGEEHADVEVALREEAHLDERSGVWGAAIAWIEGLEPSGLDGHQGQRRLQRLLAIDGPAPVDEPLVVEASAMVVLDYVIGNWDRLSGGNLFVGPDRGLVLLDNNGAFSRWSETKQQRMDELLGDCQRFSRRLTRSLRALDAAAVEQALAAEPWHSQRRLLSERQIDLLFERRDAVLAAVDRLVAEHGEQKVLAFP
jgi:hypothetical protein